MFNDLPDLLRKKKAELINKYSKMSDNELHAEATILIFTQETLEEFRQARKNGSAETLVRQNPLRG